MIVATFWATAPARLNRTKVGKATRKERRRPTISESGAHKRGPNACPETRRGEAQRVTFDAFAYAFLTYPEHRD
jgi:hypothetical protein